MDGASAGCCGLKVLEKRRMVHVDRPVRHEVQTWRNIVHVCPREPLSLYFRKSSEKWQATLGLRPCVQVDQALDSWEFCLLMCSRNMTFLVYFILLWKRPWPKTAWGRRRFTSPYTLLSLLRGSLDSSRAEAWKQQLRQDYGGTLWLTCPLRDCPACSLRQPVWLAQGRLFLQWSEPSCISY